MRFRLRQYRNVLDWRKCFVSGESDSPHRGSRMEASGIISRTIPIRFCQTNLEKNEKNGNEWKK